MEQTHARESAGEGKDEAEREGNERKRRTNRSLVFFSFSLGHYTHTHTHTPAPSALRPHAAPASPASRHPPLSLKVRAAPAACAQRRSARESGRERTDKTPPFPFRSSFRLSPLRLRLRRAEGSAPRVHCRVPWARPVVCSERGGGRGGREGCWQEGARCFPFSPFRSPLFPLFSLFSLLAFSVRLSSLALRLPTHSSPSHHCAAVVVCAQGERCLWRTALWFSRPVGFFFFLSLFCCSPRVLPRRCRIAPCLATPALTAQCGRCGCGCASCVCCGSPPLFFFFSVVSRCFSLPAAFLSLRPSMIRPDASRRPAALSPAAPSLPLLLPCRLCSDGRRREPPAHDVLCRSGRAGCRRAGQGL